MATALKASVKQVVVYLSDGTTLTVDVDAGTNLEGLVFNRGVADKCPAPHGQWPPKGVHFRTGAATLPTTSPTVATADSMTMKTMDAPAPPPPPPGCYLVDGVLYCP